MSLSDALSDAKKRDHVIDDCVGLVDAEVDKKSGLGGLVIKAGYKAVKGIKPGFIRQVVSSLLDEWIAAIQPIWDEGSAKGGATGHLERERDRVADALLSVTDAKSKRAKNGLVRSTYDKLRPTAKKHVEEAVPALAALLARHAS